MSEILKNTLTAELLWLSGANTDVCPGRQTLSRRHWWVESCLRIMMRWTWQTRVASS